MRNSSSNTEDYYSCNSNVEMNDADSDKQSSYYTPNIKDKETQIENLKVQTKILNEELIKYLKQNTLLGFEIFKLNEEKQRLIKEKNISEVEKELDIAKYELFELKK